MKILHTSDWHLGLDFYGASLHRDQEAMVDRIADIAVRERVGAVLLAGDVFDRAVVGAEAMGLYNRAMRRLCLEERIPVVVCAGNHDGAARLSLLRDLLAPSGLHVFGRAGAQDDAVDLGEAVVHVLPYLTTDDARQSFPDAREEIGSAAEAMALFLARRAPAADGRFHILLGHCFAAGGVAGRSDRAAAVGGALAVPVEAFAPFQYAALGHLHRAQTLAGGRVRYCGAPLAYAFDEAGQEKGVTILDTADGSLRQVAVEPLRPVEARAGTVDELLAGESDAYLHLTVADALATASVQEALRKRYPNALLIESALLAREGGAMPLTAREAAADTPLTLAEKFYLYKTGLEMDEEQRAWFRSAVEEAERG
ncbi:MAG: exonuclease SbcCD subunit D [Candidatus Spyradocola sp.]|jgi:exonuclease SbcD